MGTDVYLKWKGQTEEEHNAQIRLVDRLKQMKYNGKRVYVLYKLWTQMHRQHFRLLWSAFHRYSMCIKVRKVTNTLLDQHQTQPHYSRPQNYKDALFREQKEFLRAQERLRALQNPVKIALQKDKM